MRKRKNKTDLASTQVHVQRLREENRRPNTRSTYSKCWRLWRVNAAPSPARPPDRPCGSEADGAGQEWCARRGWEDGELVWESKAILFLTDVVLPIRQVRPQKLPRAEAGARKRKMAAARQATRRCRLRQAQAQAERRRRRAGGGGDRTRRKSWRTPRRRRATSPRWVDPLSI